MTSCVPRFAWPRELADVRTSGIRARGPELRPQTTDERPGQTTHLSHQGAWAGEAGGGRSIQPATFST